MRLRRLALTRPRPPHAGRRAAAVFAVPVLAAGLALAGASGTAFAAPTGNAPTGNSATPDVQPACGAAAAGHARCQALRYVPVADGTGVRRAAAPSGLSPSDVRSAYQLPNAANGTTVAIIDAYDDPNAERDLATYRSQYGLSACTTANGCFRKINQRGGTTYPNGDSGWAAEISLDLDAVSAACPGCHILLVEADDNNDDNLYAAVDRAVALGAKFVSNSYSSPESSGQTSEDSHFNVPGVLFAFATGDNGYSAGTQYPASSRYALAVGGTSLYHSGGGSRGWSESAWSGAGSGCSAYDAKPSWQSGVVTACNGKGEADVSAVADPQTGLAIYDTYGQSGWLQYGGTSLATPLITAMYALAGTPGAKDNPTSYPYAHRSALTDVTSGSNGNCGAPLCTARSGWDGPTGLGTPLGVSAFTPPSGTTGVTVANPGNQTGQVGTAVTLNDSASGGTAPYTWSATGLPPGLAISAASGQITGTPTTAGSSNVTVSAKDSTGVTGSTTFTWTITGGGGGGNNTVTVTNPGTLTDYTGDRVDYTVRGTDSGGLPLTFTATGLPSGLRMATNGRITGTCQAWGFFSVTVTAKDSSGARGAASFRWTVYLSPYGR